MKAMLTWSLGIVVVAGLIGCGSSSGGSGGGGGIDTSFLAKAFYGFGVDVVNAIGRDTPYTMSIEFDSEGNAITLDGETVPAGAVLVSATNSPMVFELSGTQIDAGPAYIIVDSITDAMNFMFVQYGIDDPSLFLDIDAFTAGDPPDPFPPASDFDANDAAGDHTGTGFTLNADGTLNEVFENDSTSITAMDPNEMQMADSGSFAGMSVTTGGFFFNGDVAPSLLTHGYFYLDSSMATASATFDIDESHALAAPDGTGMVFAACISGGGCGDGNGLDIDITDFFFSAMFR